MTSDLLLFLLIGSVILSAMNLGLVVFLLIPQMTSWPWPLSGDYSDEED